MSSTNKTGAQTVPELLFHSVLTVIDFHTDSSGGTRQVFILGTHGTLEAAKAYTVTALHKLNFACDEFDEYNVRDMSTSGNWTHGDGVLVFARAPAGQQFLLSIDTTPNDESLAVSPSNGEVVLPQGVKFLHYVVQTTIDYNVDRTGAVQASQIEGVYAHRADAYTAAHKCLDTTRFAEYDSRGDPDFVGQWPFDEDIVVHSVAETGQNYFVAVKTPPTADTGRKAILERRTKNAKRNSRADSAKDVSTVLSSVG